MSETAPKGWWATRWRHLIIPAAGVVFVICFTVAKIVSQPSPEENMAASYKGAAAGVRDQIAAAASTTDTTEPKPAPAPYYDFLTCKGVSAEQTCQPVFTYSITPEAMALIGFQGNTADSPNMERGRSVFIQWRNMHGVNECDLSIGIEPLGLPGPDGRPVADRKLYPTQVPGRAKLLDCSPKAISAQGGVPTVGQQ